MQARLLLALGTMLLGSHCHQNEEEPFNELEAKKTLLLEVNRKDSVELTRVMVRPLPDPVTRPVCLAYAGDQLLLADQISEKVVAIEDGFKLKELAEARKPGGCKAYRTDSYAILEEGGIRIPVGADAWKQVRLFHTVFDFLPSFDGSFYVNPRYRGLALNKPLIIHLNEEGRVQKSFGKRSTNTKWRGADNQVFLDQTRSIIVAAFNRRPLVRFYDAASGQLLRSTKVAHPIFGALGKMACIADSSPERIHVPRYLAGLRVLGDHVFILLHLPHLEVWEMTLDGLVKAVYVGELPFSVLTWRGFEVVGNDETARFLALATRNMDTRVFFTEFQLGDEEL